MSLILLLCSGPLLLKVLGWIPVLGISLCQGHDFQRGAAPDRQEMLKMLKGHSLNLQAGCRLQDTSWTVLHTLVPEIETGTAMNIFLPSQVTKCLKLPITKTKKIKVKIYKFLANSLAKNQLHGISHIPMPRTACRGHPARHTLIARSKNAPAQGGRVTGYSFRSQVLQSA